MRSMDASNTRNYPDRATPKLTGKIALVTGAGRGLGHAIARRFLAEGAHIVAVARTASELAALAAPGPGEIETIQADLSSSDEMDRLSAAILERHGRLDVLVNNAAVLRMTAFVDLAADAFNETIAVNLLAPVQLTRAFLPGMIARGSGAIINVTSRAGIEGFELETDYCAAKFGLEGFTRSLALEIDGSGVSTSLVTPGRSIKPTSVTAAEWKGWPEERKAEYTDPMQLTNAFVHLALADPTEISGKRFSAWELSTITVQGRDIP